MGGEEEVLLLVGRGEGMEGEGGFSRGDSGIGPPLDCDVYDLSVASAEAKFSGHGHVVAVVICCVSN